MEKKLQILNSFYYHQRRMPTYSEMMVLFDYKSKNSVSKLIQKFIRYGVLEKDEKGHIVPSVKQGPVRLLRLIDTSKPELKSNVNIKALDKALRDLAEYERTLEE